MTGAQPPQMLGEYVLEQELGRGGMGAVYLVRHARLGVVRALKVLHRPDDPRKLARFEREANHLARIQHPNVVRIHEVGQTQGLPWFVMERIEGDPLDAVLERGRLSLDGALRIATGIAEGVAALHAAGILHRDLKPQNVVLTPDGRPIVLDLGLAVAPDRDERLTKTGTTLGTLRYMAPEQLKGAKAITARTDVFALGLILFELATGQPAVEANDSAIAVAAELLDRPRPAPSSRDGELPVRLDAVCGKALAQDPEARYADAGELAAALAALSEAPGPSRSGVRRKQALGVLAGLGALAVLAVVGVALFGGPRKGSGEPTGSGAAVGDDSDGSGGSGGATPAAAGGDAPLDPAAIEAGDRELQAATRREPAQRLPLLDAWLADYPTHPSAGEASALRAQTLLEVPLRSFEHPQVRDVVFLDPACQRALAVGLDDAILWDLGSGERLRRWKLPQGAVDLALLPPDGDAPRVAIVVGGDRATALTLTAKREDGPPAKRWFVAKANPGASGEYGIGSIAASPDGGLVAVGGHGVPITILRWPDAEVVRTLTGFGDDTSDLTFSPDGRYLLSCHGAPLDRVGKQRKVNETRVWDVASGELFLRVPAFAMVKAAVFTPDGERFLVARDGTRLLVHELATGEEVAALNAAEVERGPVSPDKAHLATIRDVTCFQDRPWAVSVAGETYLDSLNDVRFWELEGMTERHRIAGLAGRVDAVDLTPDGRWMLVALRGKSIQLWDLAALSTPD